MRDYLASRGVAVPATVPKGRTGNKNFMVKDPDGHNVEIVEYQPDSWTAQGRRADTCRRRGSPDTRAARRHPRRRPGCGDDVLQRHPGFEEFWRGRAANSNTLSWVNMRVPDGTDYLEFMLYDAHARAGQARLRASPRA